MINDLELKKGNWVLFSPYGKKEKVKDRPVKVSQLLIMSLIAQDSGLELELFYEGASVKPIPLSPEVLEACGFLKQKPPFGDSFVKDRFNVQAVLNGYVFVLNGGFSKEIESLHQLQNLYFALSGEELIYKP